jgi:hypothetical protein
MTRRASATSPERAARLAASAIENISRMVRKTFMCFSLLIIYCCNAQIITKDYDLCNSDLTRKAGKHKYSQPQIKLWLT